MRSSYIQYGGSRTHVSAQLEDLARLLGSAPSSARGGGSTPDCCSPILALSALSDALILSAVALAEDRLGRIVANIPAQRAASRGHQVWGVGDSGRQDCRGDCGS